jgi:putative membrane protein
MAQDHSATATKLSAAAKPAGIPVPTAPGPDQKATRASLEGLQGAAFDAVYLQAQLIEHQKTVQLLEWEIGSGQEASLQRLAMETLPVVLDHLAMVQALIAETRGTVPQGLAGAQLAERMTRP